MNQDNEIDHAFTRVAAAASGNAAVQQVETPASTSAISDLARERFWAVERKPTFLCEWPRVLFVHYEVEPDVLQPRVPFKLELFRGQAVVSLAAFTMRRFRPRAGGKLGEWLFRPAATNHFLNVRAYVRHRGEPGVYFMTQWLSHPFCLLGRLPMLRLPWRLGRMRFAHAHEIGRLAGEVRDGSGCSLRYTAMLPARSRFSASEHGSLAEFATERYSAFALRAGVEVVFRVWHKPWAHCPVEVEVKDAGLLAQSGDWHRLARLAGADYTIGCPEVWMGRPHRICTPTQRRYRGALSAFWEMP